MSDSSKENSAFQRRPKVTVLVPTIGRMQYLPRVVESIREQTFGDYEVLVWTTTRTSEQGISRNWAASEPRVRILQGVAARPDV